MRLIDADALLNDSSIVYHTEFGDAVVDVEDIIKAPTVERPHGEWKYESYGYLSTYKCSNCGFHGDKQWISCPYCGANMKEGEVE